MKRIEITIAEDGAINVNSDVQHHEFLGVLHALLLNVNVESFKLIVIRMFEEMLPKEESHE